MPTQTTCALGATVKATWSQTGVANDLNTLGLFVLNPLAKYELTVKGNANIAYSIKMSLAGATDLVPWQTTRTGPQYYTVPKGTSMLEINFSGLDSGTPSIMLKGIPG